MTTIRAVLFDYGMVLSGPADPAARKRMEELLGAAPERFGAAYWHYRDAYDRGSLNAADYWRNVAADLGRALDATTLAALIAADNAQWTQPNQAMIDWAAALQRAGIRTGVLSNLSGAMEDGVHAQFPWLQEFTHTTFSHRLGIAKPDAEIYRHAAEGLGVAPDEILFIDDREENVTAARAAGMVAILYRDVADGRADFPEQMRQAGLEGLLVP